MASNPKTSVWYSTPITRRARKPYTFTMTDETRAKLDAVAAKRGVSRSRVIEELIQALDQPTGILPLNPYANHAEPRISYRGTRSAN